MRIIWMPPFAVGSHTYRECVHLNRVCAKRVHAVQIQQLFVALVEVTLDVQHRKSACRKAEMVNINRF